MRITIASPTRPGASSGNAVTALRWRDRLVELGHEVAIAAVVDGEELTSAAIDAIASADCLVVLHARRSAAAARWWKQNGLPGPLIVALAGTDLYVDMPDDATAMATAAAADHLVVLQPRAAERLARLVPDAAGRTTVVYQSVAGPVRRRAPVDHEFRVVVLAHLRDVKDPLLAANAAKLLPQASKVKVHHAGAHHDEQWKQMAMAEEASNHRYTWHGELSPTDAQALLSTGHLLACTSLHEGGANVVTESLAMGVPVVGTRIDGNTGLLGSGYPGLVPVRDAPALAALLARLETDEEALADLQRRTDDLAPITRATTEREAWRHVLTQSERGQTPKGSDPFGFFGLAEGSADGGRDEVDDDGYDE